jgi:hypothetical protein
MIGGRESFYSFGSLLLDFRVSLQEATIGPLLITLPRRVSSLKRQKAILLTTQNSNVKS